MIKKWFCEQCGWEGDEPMIAHEDYDDGGYYACPICKWESDGEPVEVILNPNHPDNAKYWKSLLND